MKLNRPNVLIYTNDMLSASETFIRNPPLAFTRYTPYFIGSLRKQGLLLPEKQVITAHGSGLQGRIRQALWLRLAGNLGIHTLSTRLRNLQPALLQAHYGHAAVFALDLVANLKIPMIVYYHGLDATMKDEAAGRSLYTRAYLRWREKLKREATLILTQSDYLRNVLMAQGFPAEKLRTHYIGIDTSGTPPRPLAAREDIVLFAARLTQKKGMEYLIEAMKQVQEKHPSMKLVVVGDGSARERLENLAAENLRNFEFIGWQTPVQVNEWMARARLFCVPSVTAHNGDAEGFGMVFIEAQRQGTPVVSFAHGGIVEAVAHGETGLLAPERDSDALAKNLLRLIEDGDLWQKFSQAGYERVCREFDLSTLASELEAIYDQILA
jgi:glycosyltransferase involved in cell wall biosynthesis